MDPTYRRASTGVFNRTPYERCHSRGQSYIGDRPYRLSNQAVVLVFLQKKFWQNNVSEQCQPYHVCKRRLRLRLGVVDARAAEPRAGGQPAGLARARRSHGVGDVAVALDRSFLLRRPRPESNFFVVGGSYATSDTSGGRAVAGARAAGSLRAGREGV
jgi:hypothetical protein